MLPFGRQRERATRRKGKADGFGARRPDRGGPPMTILGGGDPGVRLAFEPRFRMGPPHWSFAADAHACIVVKDLCWSCRIQVRGAMFAPDGEFPLDR